MALTFHNTAPDAVDTPICNDPDAISAVARNCVPKMCQGGSYSASSGLSTRFRPGPEASGGFVVGLAEHEFFREKNLRLFDISFVFYRFFFFSFCTAN